MKRMKKSVPEVRMTVTARQRLEKTKKERATNSENTRPVATTHSTTTIKSTISRKPMVPSTKSANIICPPKRSATAPLVEKKQMQNDCKMKRPLPRSPQFNRAAHTTIQQQSTNNNQQPPKKMSALTAKIVKEKTERQRIADQINRLEMENKRQADQIELLSAGNRELNTKLLRADNIVTKIWPIIQQQFDKNLASAQQQFDRTIAELRTRHLEQQQDADRKLRAAQEDAQRAIAANMAECATTLAQKNIQLEEATAQISTLSQTIEFERIRYEGKLSTEGTRAAVLKREYDAERVRVNQAERVAATLQARVKEMEAECPQKIEDAVLERIKPWVNAKAQCDSLEIEVAMKNKKIRDQQKNLNDAQLALETLREQDRHRKSANQTLQHREEENHAKIRELSTTNSQLRNELETSRSEVEKRDRSLLEVSMSLEEEKYRNSEGMESRSNSSFQATYDDTNTNDCGSMSTDHSTLINSVYAVDGVECDDVFSNAKD